MTRVFIIGLPVSVRMRVEAAAKRRDLKVSNIAAGVGNAGTFKLLPHDSEAIYQLQGYVKGEAENYEGCFVLVLPYAQLPNDLIGELDVLKELGAKVISPTLGESRWPSKSSARRRDQAFWDALYEAINAELPGEALQLQAPSDYFQSLAANNPRLIITSRSLESADDVAKHRYEFLRRAADALDQYARSGSGGRIDAFFAQIGLDHAQSGGITATLKLHRAGEVSTHECHTHIKQGDKTTRIAAARVYYYAFTLEGNPYAVLLYAGPHPNEDVTREWHFP